MPFNRLPTKVKGIWIGSIISAVIFVIIVGRDITYYMSEIPPNFEFIDIPSDPSALYYAKRERSFSGYKNVMVLRQIENQSWYRLYAFDCTRKSYLTLDEGADLDSLSVPSAKLDFIEAKSESNELFLLMYSCK